MPRKTYLYDAKRRSDGHPCPWCEGALVPRRLSTDAASIMRCLTCGFTTTQADLQKLEPSATEPPADEPNRTLAAVAKVRAWISRKKGNNPTT